LIIIHLKIVEIYTKSVLCFLFLVTHLNDAKPNCDVVYIVLVHNFLDRVLHNDSTLFFLITCDFWLLIYIYNLKVTSKSHVIRYKSHMIFNS
jgi:hypothetical protein